MSKLNNKVAVFIGCFQPFHLGHQHVVEKAYQSNKYKQIIFLLGSADQARTPKNPFTFEERKKMISSTLDSLQIDNKEKIKVDILPIHDFIYDNQKWIAEVQNQIASVVKEEDKIVLIGNIKDETSEYLKYFPQYETDFTAGLVKNKLSATDLRFKYFSLYDQISKVKETKSYLIDLNTLLKTVFKEDLNDEVVKFLVSFSITKALDLHKLVEEFKYIQNYRNTMLEKLPFKNIAFFTGDALVTCAGHILLVKRKIAPGKGLYALPGGFFDGQNDLNSVETAIRELYEETKIGLPKQYIRSHIVKSDEFGDFNRSERWRVITKTVYVKLPDTELPKVKGSDDAAEAIWMPFVDLKKNRDKFFEDHLSIIDTFLNVL